MQPSHITNIWFSSHHTIIKPSLQAQISFTRLSYHAFQTYNRNLRFSPHLDLGLTFNYRHTSYLRFPPVSRHIQAFPEIWNSHSINVLPHSNFPSDLGFIFNQCFVHYSSPRSGIHTQPASNTRISSQLAST